MFMLGKFHNRDLDYNFRINLLNNAEKSQYYDIVITLDNRLVNVIFVQMVAMAKNLSRKIRLWILQCDFSDEQKKELFDFALKCNIELNIIQVDISKYQKFNSTRLPRQTYFYLDAANILPNEIDRCLVMDVDTLILKDISDFYDINFEDAYLVAANEYEHIKFIDYLKMASGKIDFQKGNAFDTQAYFNSGVILFNLKRFRRENIQIENFEKIIQNSDIGSFFHDQIIINRFAKGQIKFVPRAYYNCMPIGIDDYESRFRHPQKSHEIYSLTKFDEKKLNSIVHFCGAGGYKPWNALKSIDESGKRIYYQNEHKSQYQFIDKWWQYAEEIPVKNYLPMYNKSTDSIQKESELVNSLENELTYFKRYTQIFRQLIETDGNLNKIVSYLNKNKYHKIGIFKGNQVTYALIPYLESNGILIEYVVENYKVTPHPVKKSIPINSQIYPKVDLMIILDVINPVDTSNNIRKKVAFPIITMQKLIDESLKLENKKNKLI